MNWEYPALSPDVELPSVVEMWSSHVAGGGEVPGHMAASLALALAAVFLFFLHRSTIVITYRGYVDS